jgi:hypothetical protein
MGFMRNKVTNTMWASTSWSVGSAYTWTLGSGTITVSFTSPSVQETKETNILERLILTLVKLEIATDYYEDYGCDTRDRFLIKLRNIAKVLLDKKYYKYIIADRHSLSHLLSQVQELAEQKNSCLHPSFFLVDSS